MSYTFQSIESREQWEQFVLSRAEANFLQSWNWGVFQERLGKKVFRFGVFSDQTQVGALLAVKETARRGNYLTVAGGPLLAWEQSTEAELRDVFSHLKTLARSEQCAFIRFRPQTLDTPELRKKLTAIGVRPSPMHLTADLTLQLDLTQPLDHILANMRKNTRYEVRKAEREKITTEFSKNPAEIQKFYEHQVALAQKHHFVPFSYEFLHEQFSVFAQDDQALLISSFQNGKLLASAFVLFYNGEAVYHYGISTPENDHLPGSYACQWAAIEEAKKRGCVRYNFWGIAPEGDKQHRFAGVSLFKRGFGGEEVAYLPAHDLPVSLSYWPTYFFELLRRKSRHL